MTPGIRKDHLAPFMVRNSVPAPQPLCLLDTSHTETWSCSTRVMASKRGSTKVPGNRRQNAVGLINLTHSHHHHRACLPELGVRASPKVPRIVHHVTGGSNTRLQTTTSCQGYTRLFRSSCNRANENKISQSARGPAEAHRTQECWHPRGANRKKRLDIFAKAY